MTEEEWLACEVPIRMLEFLQREASDRKFRLLACAIVRSLWQYLDAHTAQPLVDTFEAYTDGRTLYSEVNEKRGVVSNLAHSLRHDSATRAALEACLQLTGMAVNDSTAYWSGRAVVFDAVRVEVLALHAAGGEPDDATDSASPYQAKVLGASLVRDIFGNPFRPVAFDAAWRTSTAVALAAQMYESREFGAMPILADALQDAGCDNPDILNHCRDTAQGHVRGCWVVDLVLGKV